MSIFQPDCHNAVALTQNLLLLLYTRRDACVSGHITITLFGKHRNLMYLVFAAYYNSMIFSKICLEGGDFPRIIEIALLFDLQLSKLG